MILNLTHSWNKSSQLRSSFTSKPKCWSYLLVSILLLSIFMENCPSFNHCSCFLFPIAVTADFFLLTAKLFMKYQDMTTKLILNWNLEKSCSFTTSVSIAQSFCVRRYSVQILETIGQLRNRLRVNKILQTLSLRRVSEGLNILQQSLAYRVFPAMSPLFWLRANIHYWQWWLAGKTKRFFL